MRELSEEAEIGDTFSDEHVFAASHNLIPWFTDFENYEATDIFPSNLSVYQRSCGDRIIRRFKLAVEILSVLEACHSSRVDGHHTGIGLPTRFCSVGNIGELFTKMLMSLPSHLISSKEMEEF